MGVFMNKMLVTKTIGAATLVGIIISAILYGSPLSLVWNISALCMTALFVVPTLISKKHNQFLFPIWAAVIAGMIGLVLMIINIKNPSKVGAPMAFSLITGLYAFIYLLISGLFENRLNHSEKNQHEKNTLIASIVLIVMTLFFMNQELSISQIIDFPTIGYFFGLVLAFVLSKADFKNVPSNIFEASILSGVIIFIISLVQILQNLSSAESLITSLGMAFLAPLYAFITATAAMTFFKPNDQHVKLVSFSFGCTSIYLIQFLIVKYLM